MTELWEHGSDFEWCYPETWARDQTPWTEADLWISARAAWQSLIAARGWRRIWVPSYYCHDMTRAARAAGAEILVYLDDPRDDSFRVPPVADVPGEALLVVNTFGRRRPSRTPFEAGHCELIEDHSHDPLSAWAWNSRADWCVASLRKTLPVPVGGVVWSPRDHRPTEPSRLSAKAAQLAQERLIAMALKRVYLEGVPMAKSEFRQGLISTEEGLADLEPSLAPVWAAAFITTFPVAAWRERRRANFAHLASSLDGRSEFRILRPAEDGSVALGAVLVFDSSALAAAIATELIERSIYPARLWPLDGYGLDLPQSSTDLSSKTVLLHCDGRYGAHDLERVAGTLLDAVGRRA